MGGREGPENVLGLLVRAVTNVGHQGLTLELTAHTGIDTLGPPPCLLNGDPAVGLMTLELVSLLLDDFRAGKGNGHGLLQTGGQKMLFQGIE